MTTPQPKPSEEQMWAGPSGQRWLANALRFEATLRPFGDALFAAANLAPGQHVLDLGCGAGGTTLSIAPLIAPGTVTGLDISPDLIAEATRRAAAVLGEKSPARFVCADASRSNLPPRSFDRLTSRFGSMFFTDPYAAFIHLHSLLKPDGGKLAFAVWAPLPQNLWMLEVRTILAAHFDLTTPPPRIPGPFAFDDPAYLADILAKSHFHSPTFTPLKLDMHVGGPNSSPASAAEFLMHALSTAQRALDAPEPLLTKVRTQLITRLETFNTPTGVRMPASAWLVTASA